MEFGDRFISFLHTMKDREAETKGCLAVFSPHSKLTVFLNYISGKDDAVNISVNEVVHSNVNVSFEPDCETNGLNKNRACLFGLVGRLGVRVKGFNVKLYI